MKSNVRANFIKYYPVEFVIMVIAGVGQFNFGLSYTQLVSIIIISSLVRLTKLQGGQESSIEMLVSIISDPYPGLVI